MVRLQRPISIHLSSRKVSRICPTKVASLLGFGAKLVGVMHPLPFSQRHAFFPQFLTPPFETKHALLVVYTRLPQRWKLKWQLQKQEFSLNHHHYRGLSRLPQIHQTGRLATKMSFASVLTSASGLRVDRCVVWEVELAAVRMYTLAVRSRRGATANHKASAMPPFWSSRGGEKSSRCPGPLSVC